MTSIQIIVSTVSIVGMLILAYFDLKHEFKWIREVTGADRFEHIGGKDK